MEFATWLSVLVLGPGSVAVFVWFLADVTRIFGRERRGDEERTTPQAATEKAPR